MDLKLCEQKTTELINFHIPGWSFSYDRARRRFGCTHYTAKKISLSRVLCEMNDWETIRLVVLHEIAHALVGSKHGHDATWKRKCLQLGGDGKRLYTTEAVNTPEFKYKATCPVCGKEYYRLRAPRKKCSCSECCKTFSRDRVLVFEKI